MIIQFWGESQYIIPPLGGVRECVTQTPTQSFETYLKFTGKICHHWAAILGILITNMELYPTTKGPKFDAVEMVLKQNSIGIMELKSTKHTCNMKQNHIEGHAYQNQNTHVIEQIKFWQIFAILLVIHGSELQRRTRSATIVTFEKRTCLQVKQHSASRTVVVRFTEVG